MVPNAFDEVFSTEKPKNAFDEVFGADTVPAETPQRNAFDDVFADEPTPQPEPTPAPAPAPAAPQPELAPVAAFSPADMRRQDEAEIREMGAKEEAEAARIASLTPRQRESGYRDIASRFIGAGNAATRLAGGPQDAMYDAIKGDLNEVGTPEAIISRSLREHDGDIDKAIASIEKPKEQMGVLEAFGVPFTGSSEKSVNPLDAKAAARLKEFKAEFDKQGIPAEDRPRIIADAAKATAWTENDSDNIRKLSTGELAINPGRLFGQRDKLVADINASDADASDKTEAIERLDAMRKASADKVANDLHFGDTRMFGIGEFSDFEQEKAAQGKSDDKVALLDEWITKQKDRNAAFKINDAIWSGVAKGALGIGKTLVGTGAGLAAATGLPGAETLGGAQQLLGKTREAASEAERMRGQTGGYGVTSDVFDTVTQMAPMFAGGAYAQGLKGLTQTAVQGMSVYGWAAAQGYESKIDDAVTLAREKKGSELTPQEVTQVLGDRKTQVAGFLNAANNVILSKVLGGGSEAAALGKAAESMTVREFLAKGGAKALRDPAMRKELKAMGKTFFGDAADEMVEETLNQAFDDAISSVALGKELRLGDTLENAGKGGAMGWFIGGAAPVVRGALSAPRTNPAEDAARDLIAGAAQTQPLSAAAANETAPLTELPPGTILDTEGNPISNEAPTLPIPAAFTPSEENLPEGVPPTGLQPTPSGPAVAEPTETVTPEGTVTPESLSSEAVLPSGGVATTLQNNFTSEVPEAFSPSEETSTPMTDAEIRRTPNGLAGDGEGVGNLQMEAEDSQGLPVPESLQLPSQPEGEASGDRPSGVDPAARSEDAGVVGSELPRPEVELKRLKSELEMTGTAEDGDNHYSIQQANDGTFYVRRTVDGVREDLESGFPDIESAQGALMDRFAGKVSGVPAPVTETPQPGQSVKPETPQAQQLSEGKKTIFGYDMDVLIAAQRDGRLNKLVPPVDHAKAAEKILSDAKKFQIPVAKSVVESYGLSLPGYALEGDTYIYQPTTPTNEPTQGTGPAPTPEATPDGNALPEGAAPVAGSGEAVAPEAVTVTDNPDGSFTIDGRSATQRPDGGWQVQTEENRQKAERGERQIGGDRIFKTREEAIEETRKDILRERANSASRAKADAEKAAAEANETERRKPLSNFTANMTPMQRGKAEKTLRTEWYKRNSATGRDYKGEKFQVMRDMIADGYRPVMDGDKPRFEREDGSGYDINKTDFAYAEWAVENQPETEVEEEEEPTNAAVESLFKLGGTIAPNETQAQEPTQMGGNPPVDVPGTAGNPAGETGAEVTVSPPDAQGRVRVSTPNVDADFKPTADPKVVELDLIRRKDRVSRENQGTRKGEGLEVLKKAEEHFATQGVEKIVGVADNVPGLLAFYKKNGYTIGTKNSDGVVPIEKVLTPTETTNEQTPESTTPVTSAPTSARAGVQNDASNPPDVEGIPTADAPNTERAVQPPTDTDSPEHGRDGTGPTETGVEEEVQDVPLRVETPTESDEDVLALRKAWTDSFREAQGLMASDIKVSQSDQEALDAAAKLVADHKQWEKNVSEGKPAGEEPIVGQALIADLAADPRVTTKTEKALLLHELMLQDKNTSLARKKADALPSDAPVQKKVEAENELTRALEDLQAVLDIIRLTNSMSGLALQGAKLVTNRQFDLVQMKADRLRWLNGGEKAPTKVEKDIAMEEVEEMHGNIKRATERYEKAEQALKDYQSKVDEDAVIRAMEQEEKLREAYEKGKSEAEAKAAKSKEARAKRSEKREGKQERLQKRADAARERLKKRLGVTSAGVDPTFIADIADLGASYLAKSALSFNEFVDKLVGDLGAKIRDMKVESLRKAYERSLAINAEEDAEDEKQERIGQKIKTPDDILKRIDADTAKVEGLQGNAIYQMARAYIKQGLRGRAVIDAVTARVQELMPEVTRDQVSDAFTGYGRVIFPSSDTDNEILSHLRNAERIQRQIEDIAAGKMPKRTGIQRRTPDQLTRELTKQRNEALKAAGFSHAQTPEALRGYLDSAERRLQNRIEDLDTAIAKNTPLPGKKPGPDYSDAPENVREQLARIEGWTKERDALQRIYDSTFKTEPDKLQRDKESASKAIDRYLQMLVSGKTAVTPAAARPTDAELETLQSLRDTFAKQVADARKVKPSEDEIAQKERDAHLAAAEKTLTELERRITERDLSAKTKNAPRFKDDTEINIVREKINSARETIKEMRKADKPAKAPVDPLDQAKENARITGERLQRVLASNDRKAKRGEPVDPDAELQALLDANEALRGHIEEMRKSAPLTDGEVRAAIEKELKTSEKTYARIKAKLDSGNLTVTKKAPSKLAERVAADIRVQNVRRQIKAASKELEARRRVELPRRERTDAEKLDAIEKALDREIKIEQDLAAADVVERPGKAQTPLTPALQAKKDFLKSLKDTRTEAYKARNQDVIEQKRDAKLIKDSQKRAAVVRDRIAKNDYDKQVRTPRPMSRELQEARHDEMRAKQEWSRLRGAKMLANLGWGGKVGHYGKSAVQLLRILKLGMEFGVTGRQLFNFAVKGVFQPKTFLDAMKKTGMATFSRASEQEFWNQINDPKTNPDALFYKRDGIILHGPHSEHTGFKEDIPDPELLERMAEFRGKMRALGYPAEFILATERFTRTFINAVRVAEYRKLSSSMRGGVPTPAEGKVIGNAVMNSTGRFAFNQSHIESGITLANMFTISARWALSRLAMMTGQPVWTSKGGYKGTGRARAMVAKEMYAKPALGMGVLVTALAQLLGGRDDEEKNPDGWWVDTKPGPTFGEFYIDGQKVDFSGGMRSYVKLASNLIDHWAGDGKTESDRLSGEKARKINADYMVQSFINNRRNPLYATLYDTAFKDTYYGKKEKTLGSFLDQLATPVIVGDTYNVYKSHDPATATLLALILQGGGSMQTRPKDPDAINQRQYDR